MVAMETPTQHRHRVANVGTLYWVDSNMKYFQRAANGKGQYLLLVGSNVKCVQCSPRQNDREPFRAR